MTLLADRLHASERLFSDAVIEKICRGLTFKDGFGANISEASRLLNNDPEMGYYFLIGYPGSDEENAVGHVAIVTPNLYLNVFPEDESERPRAKNSPLDEIEADVRIVLLKQCSREDLNKMEGSIGALQALLKEKKMAFSLGSLEIVCHKLSYTFPHNFAVTNESFKKIIDEFIAAEGLKKFDVVSDILGIKCNYIFQYSLDTPVFLRYALPKHTDQLICCTSAVLEALGCHPGLKNIGYAQQVEIAKVTGSYGPIQGFVYSCELKSDLIKDICDAIAIRGSSLDSISQASRNDFVESLIKIQDDAVAAYNRPANFNQQAASTFSRFGGIFVGLVFGAMPLGPLLMNGYIIGGEVVARNISDNSELIVDKIAKKLIFTAKAENPGAMMRRFDDCYKAVDKLVVENRAKFMAQFSELKDREKILFSVFSRILLSQDTYCRPENFLSSISKHDKGSHRTAYFARQNRSSQEWEIQLSFFEKMRAADLEKFLEIQKSTLKGLKRGLKLNDEIFAQCLNDFKHALKEKMLQMRPGLRSTIDRSFGDLEPIRYQIELKNRHWGSAFKELVNLHREGV